MRTWLKSIIDAMLGRVAGKTGRLDTATRMAMDADFSREPALPGESRGCERDDRHLVKPGGTLSEVEFLEELIRIVNEAQDRDANDECRLYGPPIPEDLTFQWRRPDPL
jgi:hypothetical protein